MPVRHYSAKQVTVSLAGITINGFGEDDFVSIEKEADDFEDVAGADGEVARWDTNDPRTTINVTLLATSPTNQLLSALRRADKTTAGGAGVGVAVVRNRLSGGEVFRFDEAWIAKVPDVTYARGVGVRVWKIRAVESDRTD